MSFQCAFTIRSDTRYLAPLRDWISAVAKIAGREQFPEEAVIPCSLALVEAVNNAIFHAHERKVDLPIGISLALMKGKVVMEVVDSGTGLGDPKFHEPDELITHGRGLFIIKRVMSEVTSRMNGSRHHMRMVYRV